MILPTKISPLLIAVAPLILLAPRRVASAPASDLVPSLPGYGPPPTRQWSGYLDATAGCDTAVNGKYCKIHYWFAEAEGDGPDAASSKPVVLWLNGGPGSSSILGFLTELGPLLLNATGGFMINPWSWTKEAHVLAIESPVGVGYSYCAAQADGGLCRNTDKYTASSARAALVDFFVNKFPELAGNDFFITGESYAGVYIPTLSKEILDHAKHLVNLKGIAVGDPCTDNDAQADSMDSLWYGHKYGMVPDQAFDLLWNHCKMRAPSVMARGGRHAVEAELKRHVETQLGAEWSELDLDDDEIRSEIRRIHHETFFGPGPDELDTPECKLARRKFLLQSSRGLSQNWPDHFYIDDYSLFGPGGLSKEDDDMAAWMMRPDVRRALHVEESPATEWPSPKRGFQYTSEYDACNWGGAIPPGTPSMIDFYREISPKLDVTLVYNGDTDPCVSYEGTRTALSRVGFPEVDGGGYRPWFYNHTEAPAAVLAEKAPMFGPDLLTTATGAQFGGEVVNYEHGLAFLTVHGSGHMVPQFRPQAALHMLKKLLGREMLSPLLPGNETLLEMGAKDFVKVMDAWTDKAKGPPYVVGGAAPSRGIVEVGGKESVH